jgi:hypothetical protein
VDTHQAFLGIPFFGIKKGWWKPTKHFKEFKRLSAKKRLSVPNQHFIE